MRIKTITLFSCHGFCGVVLSVGSDAFGVEAGETYGFDEGGAVVVAVDCGFAAFEVNVHSGHAFDRLNAFCYRCLTVRAVHSCYNIFFCHI